ncbi:3,4-dihydroxy-9,10-secoandrosta-1,3,5(10)-triene-9,17-dione 4,5-dioxygenase [Zhongshania antarctica]|jgi:3,4-dihydroxy-9,10-secoandrosta-1,3,5(10)-triene-9,17-dione 4,5-dioxygenase|uniref:3,4-dihydroxy-9,10-secoandrosta-1,3, 5(10)-triene-9,17-dione 4,5-dioxygenase n=2 Tax=Spongiibacteraceae TaxID=1706375 RepID=A0A840R0R4_9GAMM|nr:VOC family protein [Zhongshania antarctica]MBB5186072.1 3,4-dihydroxy-9,10-secoandrosta-1,3,5(10)-triene-9,17-dione 4,5-dioxygenase [Zhongshania antarctica]
MMDVRSLGYVVIESTNPSEWQDYGTNILGLMNVPSDDGSVYLKMDQRPYRFAIVKAEQNRLRYCGWELADEAGFKQAKEELQAAGIEFTEGSAARAKSRRVRGLIQLQDPSGNELELYWGGELDYGKFISPQGISGFETGFNGDMGFGHAVLPASKLAETHAFYTDVLGFGDSDYMHFHFSPDPNDPGQGLNFMHVNNPRHHSLALYEDAANPVGCVHLMLEVTEVDEVGYCLDRVEAAGIPVVSTLGRHTNDNMLSFYMATPAGFAMEFGTDGLQMNWDGFTPTVTSLPSLWGHKFNMPDA